MPGPASLKGRGHWSDLSSEPLSFDTAKAVFPLEKWLVFKVGGDFHTPYAQTWTLRAVVIVQEGVIRIMGDESPFDVRLSAGQYAIVPAGNYTVTMESDAGFKGLHVYDLPWVAVN